MKHKKILVGILGSICLASGLSFSSNKVEAFSSFLGKPDSFWRTPRKVILDRDTKFDLTDTSLFQEAREPYGIWSDNHWDSSYNRALESAGTKTLKAGTVITIRYGKLDEPTLVIKHPALDSTPQFVWGFKRDPEDHFKDPGFMLDTPENRKKAVLYLTKPVNIVLTKTVKIQKEKMAKAHCYVRAVGKQKTLKKGTKLQILPGGMDYNWILIKKGYTYSGVKLTKKSYQIKTHGYLWVISKNYLDDDWFKLL